MIGSDFIFDSVQQLYYKSHKINCKFGGSCTDFPDQIKKEKAAINPKDNDEKCFQHETTIVLNHENIESYPERVSIIGKELISHQKLKVGKYLKKIIRQLLLMIYILKAKKYVLLIFQKLIQIVKNK